MADDTRTLEFVGRVAMKWLEDFAENPKRGSYMEAVADLTTLILGGAIEAAGPGAEDSGSVLSPGVISSGVLGGRQDGLDEEEQAG